MSASDKTCIKCRETKPLEAFYKKTASRDGRTPRCKVCERQRAAEYRVHNPEKVSEYREANREAFREYERKYYEKNREVVAERSRQYREANREAVLETSRQHREANPHMAWEGDYRRRTRRFGHEPVVESFTHQELIERYGDACYHCEGLFEELDHYPIPVRDGGPHSLDNCRPSCVGCNRPWNLARAMKVER